MTGVILVPARDANHAYVRFVRLLPLALVLLLGSPVAADERVTMPNLLPASLWKGAALAGRGFYPRGFSPDGWFAYTRRPEGDTVEGSTESCPSPPCRDGVTIVSLACLDPCDSDSPSAPGDMCWCPVGPRLRDLARFKIAPLAKDAARGRFPARIDGQTYDLELRYRSRLVPSELGPSAATSSARGPELGRAGNKPDLPGTQVFLVAPRSGRRLIATLDHSHRAIEARSVKAIGWIKSPFGRRLAVVLGFLTRENGKRVIEVEVVGTSL